MLRVVEQYATTDTGRQRRANEDALLARSPLFVVADGMGGAQAGEVASRIAVDAFEEGLSVGSAPAEELAARAGVANARIHELSHSNAEHAGMGTTLTAAYVAPAEVAIAHVGDSRAYRLRAGELLRLTEDHSLVDELLRQGKITAEEAHEHPQRSVITRALGPEAAVEVDTRSYSACAGDLYLLCSDGLTTMLAEKRVAEIMRAHSRLRDIGEALVLAANEAGGRDNITVVLFRLDETGAAAASADGEPDQSLPSQVEPPLPAPAPSAQVESVAPQSTTPQHAPVHNAPVQPTPPSGAGSGVEDHPAALATAPPAPSVSPRRPRKPSPAEIAPARRAGRHGRRILTGTVALVLLGAILAGAYVASQSVYFIGTNARGLVTLYRGVPFQLPGGVKLYSADYVSGVSAATLSQPRRRTLLDHTLRSEGDATALLRSLELGQLNE